MSNTKDAEGDADPYLDAMHAYNGYTSETCPYCSDVPEPFPGADIWLHEVVGTQIVSAVLVTLPSRGSA